MYTFDESILSDLHKDARGYRPREPFIEMWQELSDADKQDVWDMLIQEMAEANDLEQAQQRENLEKFEHYIKQFKMCSPDIDDGDAIRWILQTENFSTNDYLYGADYVAYHFGLAYDNPRRELIAEQCKKLLAIEVEYA
jgi:hypothetical protein